MKNVILMEVEPLGQDMSQIKNATPQEKSFGYVRKCFYFDIDVNSELLDYYAKLKAISENNKNNTRKTLAVTTIPEMVG